VQQVNGGGQKSNPHGGRTVGSGRTVQSRISNGRATVTQSRQAESRERIRRHGRQVRNGRQRQVVRRQNGAGRRETQAGRCSRQKRQKRQAGRW